MWSSCPSPQQTFNFSGLIFHNMKSNLVRKDKNFKKYWMYPRFIQTMIDNANFGLEKKDKDVMVLEHMDRLTLNKVNSYQNVPESERPPYKGPFGHVRDENYIAPDNDKWRHDDSDSTTEDMDNYIAYHVESEEEGSPVVRQKKAISVNT